MDRYAVIFSLVFFAGCTHNIQLNPDLGSLRQVKIYSSNDRNVAYYISMEDKEKQITTPGGGGDTVTYKPYAETEGALNTILSKIFSKVYSLSSIYDNEFIEDKNISFIFIPKITTDSYSSSAFTWVPTEFTITLSCRVLNSSGETIWEKTVNSKGSAGFSEFRSDFSLSARRASREAFVQLLKEIDAAEIFK